MINFEYLGSVLQYVDTSGLAVGAEVAVYNGQWSTENFYFAKCLRGAVVYNNTRYEEDEDNYLFITTTRAPHSNEEYKEIALNYQRVAKNPEEEEFRPLAYYALVVKSDRTFLPLPLLLKEEERKGDPVLEELHHKLLKVEEAEESCI